MKATLNIDIESLHEVSTEFFDAYGRLMAEWAAVERGLYLWFQGVTGMREGIARGIFYSARSFNGRAEMLQAAIGQAHKQTPEEIAFIKGALKKAWSYSGFRNSVVHGEPMLTVTGMAKKDIHYTIIQGRNPALAAERAITLDDMNNAFDNFSELKRYLIEAIPAHRPKGATPEEYLGRVLALPNQPCSRSAPNPQGSAQQAQDAKKRQWAHRAMAGMSVGATLHIQISKPAPPSGDQPQKQSNS